MLCGVQEAAGKQAAEQRRRPDQERHRRVRPPRVVGPEVLHGHAIDRQLVNAKRGDIEDVIKVAGVAHAQVDEQVVDQHPQQDAIDCAQHIQAQRLFFKVGSGGPERQWGLDRALALQAQVDGVLLVGHKVELEQVVARPYFTAGKRQRAAGTGGQPVVAGAVVLVQVQMIQRWVCQLQKPGAWRAGVSGGVMQVDLEPEHRTRVTGVEGGFVMGFELSSVSGGTDVSDGEGVGGVFEHLHDPAQRQASRALVELDGAGEHRQPAQ